MIAAARYASALCLVTSGTDVTGSVEFVPNSTNSFIFCPGCMLENQQNVLFRGLRVVVERDDARPLGVIDKGYLGYADGKEAEERRMHPVREQARDHGQQDVPHLLPERVRLFRVPARPAPGEDDVDGPVQAAPGDAEDPHAVLVQLVGVQLALRPLVSIQPLAHVQDDLRHVHVVSISLACLTTSRTSSNVVSVWSLKRTTVFHVLVLLSSIRSGNSPMIATARRSATLA